MGEHERERQYKFTVTLPPRKLRKPLSPETKHTLEAICGWVMGVPIGLGVGWLLSQLGFWGWLADLIGLW